MIDPDTRIGAVHLTISDLRRSVRFYETHLGFAVHRRTERTAWLGAGGPDLLILSQCETAPRVRGTTGLYHFAILVPSRGDLARALRRLVASGFRDTTRVAASDPDLWVDICATNGPSIVAALDVLTSRLEVLRKLVAEGDRAGLREELAAARAARLRIPTKPGSSPRGLREVVVHVADRPGSLAAVFHALGAAGVNVEDLAIDHELQGGRGALRIWVAGRDALTAAIDALEVAGWPAHEGTGAP